MIQWKAFAPGSQHEPRFFQGRDGCGGVAGRAPAPGWLGGHPGGKRHRRREFGLDCTSLSGGPPPARGCECNPPPGPRTTPLRLAARPGRQRLRLLQCPVARVGQFPAGAGEPSAAMSCQPVMPDLAIAANESKWQTVTDGLDHGIWRAGGRLGDELRMGRDHHRTTTLLGSKQGRTLCGAFGPLCAGRCAASSRIPGRHSRLAPNYPLLCGFAGGGSVAPPGFRSVSRNRCLPSWVVRIVAGSGSCSRS